MGCLFFGRGGGGFARRRTWRRQAKGWDMGEQQDLSMLLLYPKYSEDWKERCRAVGLWAGAEPAQWLLAWAVPAPIQHLQTSPPPSPLPLQHGQSNIHPASPCQTHLIQPPSIVLSKSQNGFTKRQARQWSRGVHLVQQPAHTMCIERPIC